MSDPCTKTLDLHADYDRNVLAICFDCSNDSVTWGWGSDTLWFRTVGDLTDANQAQQEHDQGATTESNKP